MYVPIVILDPLTSIFSFSVQSGYKFSSERASGAAEVTTTRLSPVDRLAHQTISQIRERRVRGVSVFSSMSLKLRCDAGTREQWRSCQ
ncbi:hypothetical protein C8Q70DRAFT_1036286 [Cubamyces menziesii]|nr:hypothetical protein C8Q70DRAFT_1036286 [Cubamyces menziesii]